MVPYRGVNVVIRVPNLLDEISLHLSSAAKHAGIVAKDLLPLMWESELVDAACVPLCSGVDHGLLRGPIAARAVLQPVLEAFESENAMSSIAEIVHSKEHSRSESPPPSSTTRHHKHHCPIRFELFKLNVLMVFGGGGGGGGLLPMLPRSRMLARKTSNSFSR